MNLPITDLHTRTGLHARTPTPTTILPPSLHTQGLGTLPFFWTGQKTTISDEDADEIKEKLFNNIEMARILHYAGGAVGCVLFSCAILLYIKWRPTKAAASPTGASLVKHPDPVSPSNSKETEMSPFDR